MVSLTKLTKQSIVFVCISLALVSYSHCHLYEILSAHLDETEGPRVPPHQLFRYVTGGVSQAFWQYVNSSALEDMQEISIDCKQSLAAITNGLEESLITAFRFVDSGGKSPPGFMQAIMASLGDFDQCLAIDDTLDGLHLLGKYCAFDIYPLKQRPVDKSIFTLDKIAIFHELPFINSICLPSQCDTSEVRSLLSSVVTPLGLKMATHISCDTRESISLSNKLRSLNSTQIAAGLFILLMVTIVLTSTMVHLACKTNILRLDEQIMQKITSVSIIKSTEKLFTAREYKHKTYFVFDIIKHGIAFVSITGHGISCFSIPLGIYMINQHETIASMLSSFWGPFMTWTVSLTSAPVVYGMATTLIAYPLAVRSQLPPFAAFTDRFTRFLPAMLAMIACELLWPLTGHGPIWSRVANFVTNTCTQNWWRNLLFINNFGIDSEDICGSSSYYISVEMQLSLLGSIMILLLTKNTEWAWTFAFSVIIGSYLHIAYNVISYDAPGCFLHIRSAVKVSRYANHVHMTASYYVPAYMFGMVAGYMMVKKKQIIRLSNSKDNIICFLLWLSFSVVLHKMHRVLLDDHVSPLLVACIVVALNIIQSIAWVFLYLQMIALWPFSERQVKRTNSNDTSRSNVQSEDSLTSSSLNENPAAEERPSFNLLKGLSRLTVAIFFVNYMVIRTWHFSERVPYQTSFSATTRRLIVLYILNYLAAYFFYVILLVPMELARQAMFNTKVKPE